MGRFTSTTLAETWYATYCGRQKGRYDAEDTSRLDWKRPADKSHLVRAFVNEKKSNLDPPNLFRLSFLQEFFMHGDLSLVQRRVSANESARQDRIILLDDRHDPIGTAGSTRIWDSTGDGGYLDHPFIGKSSPWWNRVLDIPSAFERLDDQVSFTFLALPKCL
jgi:hypothetical protein